MDYKAIVGKINREFEAAVRANSRMAALYKKTLAGDLTYLEAQEFAGMTGEFVGKILHNNLAELFPDGIISEEDLIALLPEPLRKNYDFVSLAAEAAQNTVNKQAGVGLKAIVPDFDMDRVSGLAKEVALTGLADSKTLIKQIQNLSLSTVDEAIRENVRAHERAGLGVTVTRKYDGIGVRMRTQTCQWCLSRAGTYTSYADALASGAFQRHPGCGCTIVYSSKKSTTVQTDWTQNKWEEVGRRR